MSYINTDMSWLHTTDNACSADNSQTTPIGGGGAPSEPAASDNNNNNCSHKAMKKQNKYNDNTKSEAVDSSDNYPAMPQPNEATLTSAPALTNDQILENNDNFFTNLTTLTDNFNLLSLDQLYTNHSFPPTHMDLQQHHQQQQQQSLNAAQQSADASGIRSFDRFYEHYVQQQQSLNAAQQSADESDISSFNRSYQHYVQQQQSLNAILQQQTANASQCEILDVDSQKILYPSTAGVIGSLLQGNLPNNIISLQSLHSMQQRADMNTCDPQTHPKGLPSYIQQPPNRNNKYFETTFYQSPQQPPYDININSCGAVEMECPSLIQSKFNTPNQSFDETTPNQQNQQKKMTPALPSSTTEVPATTTPQDQPQQNSLRKWRRRSPAQKQQQPYTIQSPEFSSIQPDNGGSHFSANPSPNSKDTQGQQYQYFSGKHTPVIDRVPFMCADHAQIMDTSVKKGRSIAAAQKQQQQLPHPVQTPEPLNIFPNNGGSHFSANPSPNGMHSQDHLYQYMSDIASTVNDDVPFMGFKDHDHIMDPSAKKGWSRVAAQKQQQKQPHLVKPPELLNILPDNNNPHFSANASPNSMKTQDQQYQFLSEIPSTVIDRVSLMRIMDHGQIIDPNTVQPPEPPNTLPDNNNSHFSANPSPKSKDTQDRQYQYLPDKPTPVTYHVPFMSALDHHQIMYPSVGKGRGRAAAQKQQQQQPHPVEKPEPLNSLPDNCRPHYAGNPSPKSKDTQHQQYQYLSDKLTTVSKDVQFMGTLDQDQAMDLTVRKGRGRTVAKKQHQFLSVQLPELLNILPDKGNSNFSTNPSPNSVNTQDQQYQYMSDIPNPVGDDQIMDPSVGKGWGKTAAQRQHQQRSLSAHTPKPLNILPDNGRSQYQYRNVRKGRGRRTSQKQQQPHSVQSSEPLKILSDNGGSHFSTNPSPKSKDTQDQQYQYLSDILTTLSKVTWDHDQIMDSTFRKGRGRAVAQKQCQLRAVQSLESLNVLPDKGNPHLSANPSPNSVNTQYQRCQYMSNIPTPVGDDKPFMSTLDHHKIMDPSVRKGRGRAVAQNQCQLRAVQSLESLNVLPDKGNPHLSANPSPNSVNTQYRRCQYMSNIPTPVGDDKPFMSTLGHRKIMDPSVRKGRGRAAAQKQQQQKPHPVQTAEALNSLPDNGRPYYAASRYQSDIHTTVIDYFSFMGFKDQAQKVSNGLVGPSDITTQQMIMPAEHIRNNANNDGNNNNIQGQHRTIEGGRLGKTTFSGRPANGGIVPAAEGRIVGETRTFGVDAGEDAEVPSSQNGGTQPMQPQMLQLASVLPQAKTTLNYHPTITGNTKLFNHGRLW